MNPRRYIEELCRRYRVPAKFGLRMQPLVERAQDSDPEKRARLLELVVRSFEYESRRSLEDAMEADPPRSLSSDDRKALATVASILHRWDPPRWLDRWRDRKQG